MELPIMKDSHKGWYGYLWSILENAICRCAREESFVMSELLNCTEAVRDTDTSGYLKHITPMSTYQCAVMALAIRYIHKISKHLREYNQFKQH